MQPVVETLEGLERRIEIAVALADVELAVKSELKKAARTAKSPGFRPGKVPMSILERSHAPGIRYDVINQKVGQALDESLQQSGLKVAGSPSLEPKQEGVPEGKLAFYATFEVYPEITLPDLSAMSVNRANCPVTEAEVEKTLKVLREQRALSSLVRAACCLSLKPPLVALKRVMRKHSLSPFLPITVERK